MSSDIYIDMRIVLSHPGCFNFKAALNGDMETIMEAYYFDEDDDPDWEWIQSLIQPVLLCKFGARDTWRVVEVRDRRLHVWCNNTTRVWLEHWLLSNNFDYEVN